jgi:hypothetical protein
VCRVGSRNIYRGRWAGYETKHVLDDGTCLERAASGRVASVATWSACKNMVHRSEGRRPRLSGGPACRCLRVQVIGSAASSGAAIAVAGQSAITTNTLGK